MPVTDGPDAPYWQGLAEGRLRLPRCGQCDNWIWPAAHRCGQCNGTQIDWIERAMRGRIFAWTRTWHRFAFTDSIDLPYVSIVATVDDCGVRLLGRLQDANEADPAIGDAIIGQADHVEVEGRRIPCIIWRRQ